MEPTPDPTSAQASETTPASQPECTAPCADDSAETAGGSLEAEPLKRELAAAQRERDEYKDRSLRNLAELDNYRKRMRKELEQAAEKGLIDLAEPMLEVLDNLERALSQLPESEKQSGIAQGVHMVHFQMLEALRRLDIQPVESVGRRFDPRLHHSMMEEERKEVAPGTVIEEMVRGYAIKGRLLRAARVKVSKAAAPSTPKDAGEATDRGPPPEPATCESQGKGD